MSFDAFILGKRVTEIEGKLEQALGGVAQVAPAPISAKIEGYLVEIEALKATVTGLVTAVEAITTEVKAIKDVINKGKGKKATDVVDATVVDTDDVKVEDKAIEETK